MTIAEKLPFNHKVLVTAALLGGMAEIVWVIIYTSFSNIPAATIATQISKTFIPDITANTATITSGILIHFILSIILLFVIAKPLLARLPGHWKTTPLLVLLSTLLLVAIWTFNFMLLLPLVNPEFVTLLPYTVSLASKVMFGIAMGLTLGWSCRYGRRNIPDNIAITQQ